MVCYFMLSRTFLVAGFFVIAVDMSDQAVAHAHLASATPAVDGTVSTSPAELELKFSEPVELKFSGLKVAGPDNSAVAIGAASLAKSEDSTLVVPVSTTLGAGTYTVDWHILSKDGHKTQGSYTFTVKP